MKKLSLNKETIRHLDDRSMNRIHGGKPESKGQDCTDVGCFIDSLKWCESVNICEYTDGCTADCSGIIC